MMKTIWSLLGIGVVLASVALILPDLMLYVITAVIVSVVAVLALMLPGSAVALIFKKWIERYK